MNIIALTYNFFFLLIHSFLGTKWDIKMRTQTVEEGEKPQQSRWSDRVTLTTMSLPGELFVKVCF